MSAQQLPKSMVAHRLAQDRFDLFVRLAFQVLEPGTPLDWGWYLDAMAGALMDVEKGGCLRLLITIPPRHMKSLIGSVIFPAWVLGRDSSQKFICVSYSQDLADTHSRNFRRLIQSRFYACVFPRAAGSFIRTVENDLQTQHGGGRFSTSLGGTLTGIGADYILVDDLMKAQEASLPEARRRARQFVDETLLSRLNNKSTGRLVSIQQRLHEDDIVAHFKEKGGFRELEFPAVAFRDEAIVLAGDRVHQRRIGDVLSPARESHDTLERIRREMGNRAYQAQYQQCPQAAGGAFIRLDKIHRYDAVPERDRLTRVIQSWDVGASEEPGADYSVGTTWGYHEKTWLLLDVMRARLIYPDLLQRVRMWRKLWNADEILVENSSVGPGLFGDLWRDWQGDCVRIEDRAPDCPPRKILVTVGKEERMMAQVERLYEGIAKIPREAPWLGDLLEEIRSFPGGKHDDQVDSISQFLNHSVKLDPRLFVKGARVPSRRAAGIPLHAR